MLGFGEDEVGEKIQTGSSVTGSVQALIIASAKAGVAIACTLEYMYILLA